MTNEFHDLCKIFEELTHRIKERHEHETVTAAWLGNCLEQEDCADIYLFRGIRMGSGGRGSDV